MDGQTFEQYCALLLKYNGFENITTTPKTGDQGVNILAEKSDIKYAIQCKYYSRSLGNTPVQEVSAGRIYYGCHVGAVMTNSTFTHGAVDLAKATGTLLWDKKYIQQLAERLPADVHSTVPENTSETIMEEVSEEDLSKTQKDDNGTQGEPTPAYELKLRDFPQFEVENAAISIYDDEVHIKKRVMTKYGKGTSHIRLNGNCYQAIIYKKPSIFSSGYLQFKFKPKTSLTNLRPDLIDVDKGNVANFLTIGVTRKNAKTIEQFFRQLSEDVGVVVTEI